VKIPFHLNNLVADDFDPNDPVFKELTVRRSCAHYSFGLSHPYLPKELHQVQMNKKLRKKQMLPMDSLTVEAMQGQPPSLYCLLSAVLILSLL